MRRADILDSNPTVIHCNINIVHHQLRDLLQPAGEKGKVLFVNGLRIDCADFNTKKVPTTFSTLDFSAVCLTTGAGLVAAGGQQSELDIRPLLPLPTSCNETAGESSSSSTARSSEIRQTSSHLNDPSSSRHSHRWHLRTPTGGSINNSICIQPDLSRSTTSSCSNSYGVTMMRGSSSVSEDKELCRHREKRRKEISEDMQEDNSSFSAWRRDDPSGRLAMGTPSSDGQVGEASQSSWASVLERNRIGMLASEAEKNRLKEEKSKAQRGQVFCNGLMATMSTPLSTKYTGSVRVLVSNNDMSVKEFRLRPPTRWKPAHEGSSSGPGDAERIENGLPGLSRLQTVQFPTCINHSSFSPDGRHLVSVGDTAEVFLYSVQPIGGELRKIATYTASSDASFSTSWSPDGMQFAVASQDGLISIWDVRSAYKIASLQTSQMNDIRGSGAARVVKWSPRGDLLAFSEHTNYIHIVETSTFTSGQRIKVPSGVTGRTGNLACNVEQPSNVDQSSEMEVEVHIDDQVHSSIDPGTSHGGLEDSPALPSRLTASERPITLNTAAANNSGWQSARRYREIGSNVATRSPLDRALLGEWSNSRRGGGSNSQVEVYIDNIPTPTTAFSRDVPPVNTDTSTTVLARTVDNIMATFENDTGLHGSNFWTLGGHSRRSHRSEHSIDISGLTWDPDGEHLYVSTEDLIARYAVLDLRRSFGQAVMR